MRDQLASFDALHALDQARGEEPRRVEGLQDVVAGGSDEAGLAELAASASALASASSALRRGQFRGALGDPALQRFIGALQGLGRLDAFGDVGEADHHAAIGHGA